MDDYAMQQRSLCALFGRFFAPEVIGALLSLVRPALRLTVPCDRADDGAATEGGENARTANEGRDNAGGSRRDVCRGDGAAGGGNTADNGGGDTGGSIRRADYAGNSRDARDDRDDRNTCGVHLARPSTRLPGIGRLRPAAPHTRPAGHGHVRLLLRQRPAASLGRRSRPARRLAAVLR